MEIKQYDVHLVNLDPTVGHEIKKTRPCLVISPDEMNRNLRTVMIAPMTTKSHDYPSMIKTTFSGKTAWIVMGQINAGAAGKVKAVVKEMLVD